MINKKQLEKATNFQKEVVKILETLIKDPTLSIVEVNIDDLKAGLANPDKTLSKMEAYVKDKAKKDAKNGCAIKTDFWVSQQVCDYYTTVETPKPKVETPKAKPKVETPKAKPKVETPKAKPKVETPKTKVAEKPLDLFAL